MSQRIAKVISSAGLCSRRQAENLIEEGRVRVDGAVVDTPAFFVEESSKIEVDDKVISTRASSQRLWLYYKPIGLVTTRVDPERRPTVFDNLPESLPRVISVGRLDIASEGLLLLTTSGVLARHLELPSSNITRIYRVRAFGDIKNNNLIKDVALGVTVEGIHYRPADIKLLSTSRSNSWFEVSLSEGKNREIRRIFDHYGLKVNRLIRTSYGPFTLGDLRPGECREVAVPPVPISH